MSAIDMNALVQRYPRVSQGSSRPATHVLRPALRASRPLMSVVEDISAQPAIPAHQPHPVRRTQPIGDGPQRQIVRPDRPASRKQRLLHAVPSAHSAGRAAEVSELGWRVVQPRLPHSRPATVRRPAQQQTRRVEQTPVHDYSVVIKRVAQLIALFALTVAAGFFIVAFFGLGPEAGSMMVVQSGDTLSSIAVSLGADVPTVEVISDIMALNSLDSTVLITGQELILPRY
ncbi:MAG: LysM peptidoglycan-binding domain-containing protein [Actinomycetaceae bacterium]|nr:LysM peptidoglycan-binding domain-containing protein [Actinomycetaceae bacterium]